MKDRAPAIETPEQTKTSEQKESELRVLMREMRSVLVAYSGGVDSAYLSLIATQELSRDALCIMAISPSVSAFQRTTAARVADLFGFNFETIDTLELADANYASNPSNRCYFCKSELYSKLEGVATERSISFVLDGTNADDLGDHRPGRIAAQERSVTSPLAAIGFRKSEIRERSKLLGLPTWDMPAAPCLSSRIAYGVEVTADRLLAIERGEEFLREEGLRNYRVRVHGDLVRLEISLDEIDPVLSRSSIERYSQVFKDLGFRYVTLDLTGFRSGSMNEALLDR